MKLSQETFPGKPDPLGISYNNDRINFAVYSKRAKKVTIALYWSGQYEPDLEVPLFGPSKEIWHIEINNLPLHTEYAFRCDEEKQLFADPYALMFANHYKWGDFTKPRDQWVGVVKPNSKFDWQGIEPPRIPLKDLVIYEIHVRGFTAHSSSQVRSPGMFEGIIEKIPYLQKLGINAIELMPIYEFDETQVPKIYSVTHQQRINYWGYHPISFFAPMSRYASVPDRAIDAFKTLVRELHRAKIEVILDVVYNHTGESDPNLISLRGLDKSAYYMIDENGHDRNFSGCGNTFSPNQEMGQRLILDSLRYWVTEFNVDGFRFDLASILTRGPDGAPMANPPILDAIKKDEILKQIKLIAEPWDAGGLVQVGHFHRWGHWSEWNSSFRDHVRNFIKGTDNEAGPFAISLCGSQFTYPDGTPQTSINFITAHDGFCLRDLVTYQHKHNIDNGENNRDGSDHNLSWNCGAEGPTQDYPIHELREKQMRNFWLALLLAQGIPMIVMGDEIGHTRRGNNNPYVQDNDINWFNWDILEQNQNVFSFVSSLISFRKQYSTFRKDHFMQPDEIDWHGQIPHHPDWKVHSRFIACVLKDNELFYLAFNADFRPALVFLPPPLENHEWRVVVNTIEPWERHHLNDPEKGYPIGTSIEMSPYSALLAICHPKTLNLFKTR